jgi:release factor glutamine methyltransferase
LTENSAPSLSTRAALTSAIDALRAAGIETPELDARRIVAYLAGTGEAALFGSEAADRQISRASLRQAIERRIAGTPVSRLIGRRGFWTLDLAIDPSVLDPRPDTETLVDAILGHLRLAGRASEKLRILDLGTGSGAIILALLSELPRAEGIGLDLSPQALRIAQENARSSGLSDRFAVVEADFGAYAGGAFDVIVANPPYIPTSDLAGLPPEVRDHDPRLALDGGPDGLAAFRVLAAKVPNWLGVSGLFAAEIGLGQAQSVTNLFEARGMKRQAMRLDLGDRPRALLFTL